MSADMSPPNPRALRDAFGCFMTGVTAVTTLDGAGKPRGFTANSFSSLSLDPPLLMVAIANSSGSREVFETAKGFAVNVLAEGQKDISGTFARPSDDRFAKIDWRAGPAGSPLIAGVSAWFDCTMEQVLPAGDHTILIGRIGAFEAGAAPGLGYYRGAYFTPSQTAAHMPTGPDVLLTAILQADDHVLLIEDGRGGLTLPMARVGKEGVQSALARLLAETGIEAEPGSIYAVYEDLALGQQHIAFRCPATMAAPAKGHFAALSANGVVKVSDPALRNMLERLAEESRDGTYGIYVGTQDKGRVSRTPGKAIR